LVRHRDLSGSLRPTSRGDNARLQQQATGTSQRGAVTWRGFGVVGAVSADAASVGGRPRRCHRRVTTSVTTTAPGPRPAPPAGSRDPDPPPDLLHPACRQAAWRARHPGPLPPSSRRPPADEPSPSISARTATPATSASSGATTATPLHPPRPRRPVPPLRRTRRDQRHPRTTSIAASRNVSKASETIPAH
jgi:hypothetical protein